MVGELSLQMSSENVARITYATGEWVKQNFNENLSVVIGHDCSICCDLFMKTASKVLVSQEPKSIKPIV